MDDFEPDMHYIGVGISSNSKTGRMMRKIFYLMAMACMMACQNDDTDFSAYTNGTASNATIPLR